MYYKEIRVSLGALGVLILISGATACSPERFSADTPAASAAANLPTDSILPTNSTPIVSTPTISDPTTPTAPTAPPIVSLPPVVMAPVTTPPAQAECVNGTYSAPFFQTLGSWSEPAGQNDYGQYISYQCLEQVMSANLCVNGQWSVQLYPVPNATPIFTANTQPANSQNPVQIAAGETDYPCGCVSVCTSQDGSGCTFDWSDTGNTARCM